MNPKAEALLDQAIALIDASPNNYSAYHEVGPIKVKRSTYYIPGYMVISGLFVGNYMTVNALKDALTLELTEARNFVNFFG